MTVRPPRAGISGRRPLPAPITLFTGCLTCRLYFFAAQENRARPDRRERSERFTGGANMQWPALRKLAPLSHAWGPSPGTRREGAAGGKHPRRRPPRALHPAAVMGRRAGVAPQDRDRPRAGPSEASGGRARASLPQALEPPPGDPGVVDGVPGVAVAEVVLHGPEVRARSAR